MAKEKIFRWFIQPMNEKARNTIVEQYGQDPERYSSSVPVLYPNELRQVSGVWEVEYFFMVQMHRDPEMKFFAFSQKGKAHKRPWNFPFDKKKKLARKIKRSIAGKKSDLGNAKKN